MRSRTRSMITALVLFCGINTSMGALGALIFEDAVMAAVYGTGVVAGAGYVSATQLRADRRGKEGASSAVTDS